VWPLSLSEASPFLRQYQDSGKRRSLKAFAPVARLAAALVADLVIRSLLVASLERLPACVAELAGGC